MTMVQVAWSPNGLLAVSVFGMFGMFFYLGAEIAGVEGRLGSRIDAQGVRINGVERRIDALAARLDARLDSLAALLQAHSERHAG
jgi:hypothetical protein